MSKKSHEVKRGLPEWTQSLQFLDDMNGGFNAVSEGMTNLSPYHIVRERRGSHVTDAARWSKGITEGKHVFEVDWPDGNNRGIASCIGLGSSDLLLRQQGRVSLLGAHSRGWCFDLRKRRSFHLNKVVNRMSKALPQRFYMYVDMDAGKIGFGDDVTLHGKDAEFYGYLISNIPKTPACPLYLMVSSCNPGEEIQVYYKGTTVPIGGFDLCGKEYPYQIAKQGLYPSLNDYEDQPPPYSAAVGGAAPDSHAYTEPVKGKLPSKSFSMGLEKDPYQRF